MSVSGACLHGVLEAYAALQGDLATRSASVLVGEVGCTTSQAREARSRFGNVSEPSLAPAGKPPGAKKISDDSESDQDERVHRVTTQARDTRARLQTV